jgi:hypothetical protein
MTEHSQINQMAHIICEMPFGCDKCPAAYDMYYVEKQVCKAKQAARRLYDNHFRKVLEGIAKVDAEAPDMEEAQEIVDESV